MYISIVFITNYALNDFWVIQAPLKFQVDSRQQVCIKQIKLFNLN